MEGFGQLFIKLVNNYGLLGAIITISFILACFYGITLGFQHLHKTIKNKFMDRKQIKLKKHQFFNDLQFLMDHKLNEVNTTCIIRRHLYIDIMKIRIKCFYDAFQNFIKEDINQLTSKELFNRVMAVIDDANTGAINKALTEGVPAFVLSSMSEKRKVVAQFNQNAIKGYCYNVYLYANNTERVYAILEFMGTSIECYMNILEENLAQFNGDIKTYVYKGISCTDCFSCVHDRYLEQLKNEIKVEEHKQV